MRKVIMGACVVSMASLSMAQHLEVGVDGGYGLGAGTALVGINSVQDTNYRTTKWEEVYASGGAGLKMRGEATCFFTENIGIMVASGYSMLGKYSTESETAIPVDTTKTTTSSCYLPINIGVKFKAKMGSIEPYLYLAPGMYFPKKSSTAIDHTIPPYSPETRDTTKTTYYYAPGWGVSAGIGAVLMVSEKVGIKLEITSTYAFAKQTKYEKEQGGVKHTYYYRDNTADSDPTYDPTYNLHNAPRDSYSSVAVNAGVCFKVF